MPLRRRPGRYNPPPSEHFAEPVAKVHVGEDMLEGGDAVDEAADAMLNSFGGEAAQAAAEELTAGEALRQELEAEHGADYSRRATESTP
jgi:hypothetical protein